MGTKTIKSLVVILLSGAMLILFCSCSLLISENGVRITKYKTMRNHLEEETGLNITSIDEWFYEEENKSVLLDIKLPLDFNPSLEDLDNIRVALNEYMQENGGFLDDGWKVTIDIDRVTKGSEKPTRYALISNFSYGYMKDGGWDNLEVSDHLNTFFFSINLDDTYYISELDGIEHIKICGLYTEYNTNLIETTIAELSELEDLESVTVYPYWYQAFSESNLDCEIIVTEDTHSGDI